MSYDLVVWEGERPVTADEAQNTFEALAGEYLEGNLQPPTPRIRQYVDVLLQRWPDLDDGNENLTPWATGPLLSEASGPVIYFAMVWSRAEEASAFAAELAADLGLVCFDPQTGTLRS